MKSLTSMIPKALVYVGGKTLLEWNIDHLSASGCTDIIIATGWKGEMIGTFVSSLKSPSKIQVIQVPHYEIGPLETLVAALDLVAETPAILCPVDLFISQTDVESVITAHRNNKASDATLAIDFEATTGSDVSVDSSGRMLSVGRKNDEASKIGKSAMLLAFSQRFLTYCYNSRKRHTRKVSSVLNTLIHEEGLVCTHPVTSRWFDIDTVDEILKLNKHILESESIKELDSVFVHAGDTMEIGDNLELTSGISIGKSVQLNGPCLIQRKCIIEDNCIIGPNVSLAENTKVFEGTSIEDSIVFGSSELSSTFPIRNRIIHQNYVIQE